MNVAVRYVISAAQDGDDDDENNKRTFGPQNNSDSTLRDITHRVGRYLYPLVSKPYTNHC